MKYWKKMSRQEQDDRISAALAMNIDFSHEVCLGIPASKLDEYVFSEQAAFLKDAPLLRTYVQNPNHIGCHTFGDSEPFFGGTQALEKEVIELLSVDFFGAEEQSCDGYIASGGTEANIEAAWIYRNLFIQEYGAIHKEIAILCSADTHYSVTKAANLLNIGLYKVKVDTKDRMIAATELEQQLQKAVSGGIKYVIVFCNMGTTMFGSVDIPSLFKTALASYPIEYRIHIDAAFGGFIYPVSHPANLINFTDPAVSSITLDAHKMLQAPYGTGIFLARKGLMKYILTKEASYVQGMDMTLSGSRGGVNAVAVWMILFTYGPFGWLEKINKLLYRTDWLARQLDALGIVFYRQPFMNIITISADNISKQIADTFRLVPDAHSGEAKWYKIVIMDHVSIDHLHAFVLKLQEAV